VELVAPFTE